LFFIIGCNKKKKQNFTQVQFQIKRNVIDKELERWQKEITTSGYVIDSKKLIDPFKFVPANNSLISQDSFSLKLVGILEKNGEKMALLEDKNKIGYIVTPNTRIGKFKVLNIGKDYITVQQEIINVYGKKEKIKKVLRLGKD